MSISPDLLSGLSEDESLPPALLPLPPPRRHGSYPSTARRRSRTAPPPHSAPMYGFRDRPALRPFKRKRSASPPPSPQPRPSSSRPTATPFPLVLRPNLSAVPAVSAADVKFMGAVGTHKNAVLCHLPLQFGNGPFVVKFQTDPPKHGAFSMRMIRNEANVMSILAQLPEDGGAHHFMRMVAHRIRDRDVGIYTKYNSAPTLFKRLADPRLVDGDLAAIYMQVLMTLIILHGRCGVIHMDAHDDNILVEELRQPAWFAYYVHSSNTAAPAVFKLHTRFHVVLFDFDRAVIKANIPRTPDVHDVCARVGQCTDETTDVTDEYNIFHADHPTRPAVDAICRAVVPHNKLRNRRIQHALLCFPQYARGGSVGLRDSTPTCQRCVPRPTDVRSAAEVLLDPRGPWAGMRTAHAPVGADYVTHVYVFPDSRAPVPGRPWCTDRDFERGYRAPVGQP